MCSSLHLSSQKTSGDEPTHIRMEIFRVLRKIARTRRVYLINIYTRQKRIRYSFKSHNNDIWMSQLAYRIIWILHGMTKNKKIIWLCACAINESFSITKIINNNNHINYINKIMLIKTQIATMKTRPFQMAASEWMLPPFRWCPISHSALLTMTVISRQMINACCHWKFIDTLSSWDIAIHFN